MFYKLKLPRKSTYYFKQHLKWMCFKFHIKKTFSQTSTNTHRRREKRKTAIQEQEKKKTSAVFFMYISFLSCFFYAYLYKLKSEMEVDSLNNITGVDWILGN